MTKQKILEVAKERYPSNCTLKDFPDTDYKEFVSLCEQLRGQINLIPMYDYSGGQKFIINYIVTHVPEDEV